MHKKGSNLHSFFHVLAIVLLNVMVGSDWVLQLIIHNHSRSLCAGATHEKHDAGPSVWEGALKWEINKLMTTWNSSCGMNTEQLYILNTVLSLIQLWSCLTQWDFWLLTLTVKWWYLTYHCLISMSNLLQDFKIHYIPGQLGFTRHNVKGLSSLHLRQV